ncbi:MAG TPA: GGDEF domain-containing protein [Longimicrobiales bacterium]|nr:GGDEF domain-containing protein [Longimicrobiales bacterium]
MNLQRRLVTGRNAPVIAGAAAAAWLLLSRADGFHLLDVLAGGAAAACALAAGVAFRAHSPGDDVDGAGQGSGGASGLEAGKADTPDASALDLMLHDIAARIGASRLVVWEPDADGESGELKPAYVVGEVPEGRPRSGDPVVWALEERHPVAAERVPTWARGPVTALPLLAGDRWVVVTGESATVPLSVDAMRDTAGLLGPVMALAEREARSRAASERLERMVEFLKTLPGESEPTDFPQHLARVAADLTEGTGAAVASWQDETGRVQAVWGEDGGPAVGTYFGIMDGELAMAARAEATIRRQLAGRAPTLAQAGERWRRAPDYLTVIPLLNLDGKPRGMVAVWGQHQAEAEGVELLVAVAPVLALQLDHSTTLARLSRTAHEDPLTGLANRAALEERLQDAHKQFHRYRRPVALMVIDLDHFKQINDTFGHQAGDVVLERLGEIVRTATRDADFAARFGGEEIVVLLPETMLREAAEVAERVRAAIEETKIEWNGRVIPVTASIGVSACPETVDGPEGLVGTADAALYQSKQGGRNRVTVATSEGSGG